MAGIEKAYEGEYFLLKATRIYRNGPIPKVGRNYLFQYLSTDINENYKTGWIDFGKNYFEDVGHLFLDYVIEEEDDDYDDEYQRPGRNGRHQVF